MAKKALWHITHSMNVDSILWKGIDPDYAEGNFKRCWFVRWHGIVWALAHISFRKRIPIWQLVAFRVLIEEGDLTHFNRNVYTCKKVVKSKDFRSAERVLSQWERQRVGKGNATKRYERALRARRAMSREAEERGSLPRSGTSPDLDSSTAPVASNVRASN